MISPHRNLIQVYTGSVIVQSDVRHRWDIRRRISYYHSLNHRSEVSISVLIINQIVSSH